MSRDGPVTCLTCCPLPYSGHGWPQTCVSLLAGFPAAAIRPLLVTPRARKTPPDGVRLEECLSFPASRLPWKLVAPKGSAELEARYARLLDEADPTRTIAYFWPGSPENLVIRARQAGILTVREMINCFQGTAKAILDRAYRRIGIPASHGITQQAVDAEIREFSLYDHIFASNPEVEKSLLGAGVEAGRILPASFGWSPSRFRARPFREQRPFRLLFVGTACVRKGVLDLIAAWQQSRVEGELLIVGGMDEAVRERMAEATHTGSIRHLPFTDDLARLYRNSDIFVFPTYEEGGPQVTLEAGGCGLPVITTPMGAARLIRHEVNGLLVEAGNVAELAQAIARLAADAALRIAFAARIAENAQDFTYEKVGTARARTLAGLIDARASMVREAG